MVTARTNARITGALFILGTVPIIVAMALWGQPLSSPDYLAAIAAHGTHIRLLALTVMFMGFACAGIGISLYPVLKPHGEGLAMGVVGFRIMEGTLQVGSAIGVAALLAVSQELAKAGTGQNQFFQGAGASITAVNDWVSNVYLLPWCAAACIYYSVFWKTRLVPRWLSAWGLAGLAPMLVSAFAAMLGFLDSSSPAQAILCLPIMIQELVLAVWLIAKGYNETP